MTKRKEIHNKPSVYSWGMKVDFMLNSQGGFKDIADASVSFLWDQELILTLKPRKIHPQFEDAGAKGYRMMIYASQTACESENIGSKLAFSLLNIAIKRRWGMSLSWPDSPLPCRVFDRTVSKGLTMQAFASSTNPVTASEFINLLEKSFSQQSNVPYSMLLSMELFASSHFENNNRSKLIMIMR